ncbi:MAG: alanine racemase, partial [Fibrobacter sp.]|nr:alanine racemase [Fibrobacter sp.]
NIDSGMGRLGLLPDQIDEFISQISQSTNLIFDGIFTHMSRADDPETDPVKKQLTLFNHVIDKLSTAGIKPKRIHFGNSATLMRYSIDNCTHVRPGIALYGLLPDPSQTFPLDLRPVVSLKGSVVKMKEVEKGTEISYGGHYTTKEKTWIATINLGYGQGIPRYLSNRGFVLIGSKRYRIAGNVTMDYIMVDAGVKPEFKTGDEVVAIGYQGTEHISPDEIAQIGGTIGYEVICNLSNSIDRFYLLNGSIVLHNSGYIF